jgi:hypothetical protein
LHNIFFARASLPVEISVENVQNAGAERVVFPLSPSFDALRREIMQKAPERLSFLCQA